MPEPGTSLPIVYQLRVVLRGISPLIWRRLLVPAGTSIAGLHDVLQMAFGWSGDHLHCFKVRGRQYGLCYDGGPVFRDDARRVSLCDLGLRVGERFVKSIPHDGKARCFGYVQTYDTKPKRRLFEVLASQGMAANQQVTFLTDGDDDVRDLPLYLNPDSEHLIDWFHITMRLTVLTQMAKGPAGADLRTRRGAWCTDLDDDDLRHLGEDLARVPRQLERLKWFLRHGNVFRALQITSDLESDLEILHDAGPEYARLHKAVREFGGYIAANAWSIPNYGERYRAGEAISTAFTESAVNQVIAKRMVKKQQMRWTPRGAHLLLQVRTRVLNGDLAGDFHRWHPGFTHSPPEPEELATAA